MNRVTNSLSVVVFALVVSSLLFVQGCEKSTAPVPKFQTEYQAIFLANGQTLFGKAEFLGNEYVLLKDVFYLRSQVNQETKQVSNSLIRKGQEWHGADQMYINTSHINVIEPVAPESRVAVLIKETKAQKPEGQKP
jgi:hypothetical protein